MKRSALLLVILCFVSLTSFSYSTNTGIDRLVKNTTTLFESIDFGASPRPDYQLFHRAMVGFYQLKKLNKLSEKDIISMIDFRKSGREKRLWVIDLKNKKLLYHTLVAHGRNTGNDYAEKFSNMPNSNQSSLGFYVTGNTYTGKHGISLKLHGMEPNINDKAESRAVVMHGADYVSDTFIKKAGRLGRSFGCPAVPMGIHKEMIPKLAKGTCLFIYYPDQQYHSQTKFNNENEASVYLNVNMRSVVGS